MSGGGMPISPPSPSAPPKQACAPSAEGHQAVNGTCYSLEQLLFMAERLNLNIPLNADKKVYQKALVAAIGDQLGNCHKCWLEHEKITSGDFRKVEEIRQKAYAPDYNNNNLWLNTTNLDDAINQLKDKHADFEYLGTVPVDFMLFPEYKITKFMNGLSKNFENPLGYPKNPPKRFAAVINTHTHRQSGEHWISMFIDHSGKKPTIAFFDSTGRRPPKPVEDYMLRYVKHAKDMFVRSNVAKSVNSEQSGGDVDVKDLDIDDFVDVKYNALKHQHGNSECGVYCINFVRRMLNGESFEAIQLNRLSDERVAKCREKYFN
jgi:hypothetical protein